MEGGLAPPYAKQVLLYQNRGKSLISMDVARNAMDFDGLSWVSMDPSGIRGKSTGKGWEGNYCCLDPRVEGEGLWCPDPKVSGGLLVS